MSNKRFNKQVGYADGGKVGKQRKSERSPKKMGRGALGSTKTKPIIIELDKGKDGSSIFEVKK